MNPIHASSNNTRRFGRFVLTALMIGIGGAAIAIIPLDNLAFAGNGNGGGQGHGHDGGKGGGNGGGGKGGQGNGGGNGQSRGHDGSGSSAKVGASGSGDSTADMSAEHNATNTTDDSMAAHNLGKLNGFFHASPNALANASPNSAIGRISHTFKGALSDFAGTADAMDPEATPPNRPSVADLGAILAGATNKTVTATQVKEIIGRLATQNPDDASLSHLADSVDEATCQDIADAANAAKSGESASDSGSADTGVVAARRIGTN